MSSISSGPEVSTIHLRNAAILYKPGLVYEPDFSISSAQEKVIIKKEEFTFSYPCLSMEKPSKMKRRAVKYERIGSENPTTGIASS